MAESKKEKTGRPKAPKLSTHARIKNSREVAQGKKNYEAMYSFITGFICFLVILFVLFGGINQRKFLIATQRMGETISEFVGRLINPTAINITDDGVYIDPEGLGENIEDATNSRKGTQEEALNEDASSELTEENTEENNN